MKKKIHVTSKDVDYWFLGTRQQAFRDFFKQVKEGKIALDRVGNLVMTQGQDETVDEQVPMRVVPALYWQKIIGEDVALATLDALGIKMDRNELVNMALKDAWVWQ